MPNDARCFLTTHHQDYNRVTGIRENPFQFSNDLIVAIKNGLIKIIKDMEKIRRSKKEGREEKRKGAEFWKFTGRPVETREIFPRRYGIKRANAAISYRHGRGMLSGLEPY